MEPQESKPKVKRVKAPRAKAPRAKAPPLQKFMYEDPCIIEIGADEVGRGPLFGRVYSAAVILPKDDSFDHSKMKDSKKFTSTKKNTIEEAAAYIKEHALAWHAALNRHVRCGASPFLSLGSDFFPPPPPACFAWPCRSMWFM